MSDVSIFEEYYLGRQFFDRYLEYQGEPVTVIIPTVHTNELWNANLLSIYREIPVKQLLIGDGGCKDDTVAIANRFPRVVIHDHTQYKSLGFSIRKLIEAVETEWFIYLHSDVYLPTGWFDKMSSQKDKYDWFGCRMQQTVMIEYDNDYGERPYAGSQMGRKEAFSKGLDRVDDDYVYRQEDFVFSDIVAKGGFKEGKIDELFHYHQTIKKPSPLWNPSDMKVVITQKLSREQDIRVWNTQFRGVIKYLSPTSDWVIREAGFSAYKLISLNEMTAKEIYALTAKVNPAWLPYVRRGIFKHRVQELFFSIAGRIRRLLSL